MAAEERSLGHISEPVRLDADEDFTRLPASSGSQQRDLLERVDRHLSAIIQRSPNSRSAS
jgi:hypothetical protein